MIDIPLNTLPGLDALPPEVTLPGNPKPVPLSPPPDPNYIFRLDVVRPIVGWLIYNKPDGLLLFGDRGSGKSSAIRQLHAYLNRPMFTISGHRSLEYEDLLGTKEIVDGDTITMDGPLIQAARLDATFLIEEIDRAPETMTVSLNPILDGYPVVNTLNSGEIIPRGPQFRIAATGNTAGSGDTTGEYNTANIMDASLLDRFWAVHVNYPEPGDELTLLKKVFGDTIPEASLRQSVEFANDVRFLHSGDTQRLSSHADRSLAPSMETTISTRALIRMWDLVAMFPSVDSPVFHALELAVTNKCSKTCAEAIRKIAEAHFAGGTAA